MTKKASRRASEERRRRPRHSSKTYRLVARLTRPAEPPARVRAVSVSVRPCPRWRHLWCSAVLIKAGPPRREGVLRSLTLPQDDNWRRFLIMPTADALSAKPPEAVSQRNPGSLRDSHPTCQA